MNDVDILADSSDALEAVKYANWFMVWGGFLFWAYQIFRSMLLHLRHPGEKNNCLWILMHLLLFAANFLYVFYELQYAYIHLYFTMIFFTDIVGIWGLYLLTKNKGSGNTIDKNHLRWF